MKNFKSLLITCTLVITGCVTGHAYNRVGVSYNNDRYEYSTNFYGGNKDKNPSFSTNGVGLTYIHGFRLKSSLPIHIEAGCNFNIGFKGKTETSFHDGIRYLEKGQFQNINLTVPVNLAFKFNLANNFYITPYAGISFKYNFTTRERSGYVINGNTAWKDWIDILKEDKANGIKKEDTWRRFQMGTHLGTTFGWKHISLGIQYGVDFIPPYSVRAKYNGLSERFWVDNTSLKVTLGYDF